MTKWQVTALYTYSQSLEDTLQSLFSGISMLLIFSGKGQQ